MTVFELPSGQTVREMWSGVDGDPLLFRGLMTGLTAEDWLCVPPGLKVVAAEVTYKTLDGTHPRVADRVQFYAMREIGAEEHPLFEPVGDAQMIVEVWRDGAWAWHRRLRQSWSEIQEECEQEYRMIDPHEQFEKDMEKAGLKVFEYRGRSFWTGPAVEVDRSEWPAIQTRTSVLLQWEELGKTNIVVYPKAYRNSEKMLVQDRE